MLRATIEKNQILSLQENSLMFIQTINFAEISTQAFTQSRVLQVIYSDVVIFRHIQELLSHIQNSVSPWDIQNQKTHSEPWSFQNTGIFGTRQTSTMGPFAKIVNSYHYIHKLKFFSQYQFFMFSTLCNKYDFL